MLPLTPEDRPGILVAGVGNIFLRDDGWGSEVARRMVAQGAPDGVRVVDYGIGGIHLAYDLLDGVDLLVLVDAVPRDVPPGTLTLMEVDADSLPDTSVDSHAMDPAALLANVRALGGVLPSTLLVGCQPVDVDEGMGLTPVVEATIDDAIDLVHEAIAHHRAPATAAASGGPPQPEETT